MTRGAGGGAALARPWRGQRLAGAVLLAGGLAGCAAPSVVQLSQQPAEGALLAGLQAYEEGQYAEAERSIALAVARGLRSPVDLAAAHKHLAFIRCTSRRIAACEAAFRAAREADPNFALSATERGHPVWGPVYRRVLP